MNFENEEREAFVEFWFTGMSDEYKARNRNGFWLTCNWTTEKSRAWAVWQARAALSSKKITDKKISELWFQSSNDVDGCNAGFTTQEHYFAHLLICAQLDCPQPTMPQPETNCPKPEFFEDSFGLVAGTLPSSKLSAHDQVTRDEFDQEAM